MMQMSVRHASSKIAGLVFIILFWALVSAAQPDADYQAVDTRTLAIPESQTKKTAAIADYIRANFSTDEDRVRAVFIWVASNLEYDVENMFNGDVKETLEEKIAKALRNRKGICENYAAVFNDVCKKLNLQSFVVVGYTRQSGFTYYIPHGWCAVFVGKKWRLYDPTWGSGYISDNKFTASINNAYYDADPAALIKTHMPFDPMWQLHDFVLTDAEFAAGAPDASIRKRYFNYNDTISAYARMDEMARFAAELRRIEAYGATSALHNSRRQYLKNTIAVRLYNEKVERQNKIGDAFNAAVADYNEGVNTLNGFIEYRNKQFSPTKTDEAIQAMVDEAEKLLTKAKAQLVTIDGGEDKLKEMIGQLKRSIADMDKLLADQKKFLAAYFPKDRAGRKAMFVKYSRTR
jgi:hypothetical protein